MTRPATASVSARTRRNMSEGSEGRTGSGRQWSWIMRLRGGGSNGRLVLEAESLASMMTDTWCPRGNADEAVRGRAIRACRCVGERSRRREERTNPRGARVQGAHRDRVHPRVLDPKRHPHRVEVV